MKKKRIIGLDASTSTVGICILDVSAKGKFKLVHYEYYKPDHEVSEFQLLKESKEYILGICKKYKPDLFAIEEYIKFIKGGSGAKTILPLAVFNRAIGLGIYEKYNVEPLMLNVNTVRKHIKNAAGLKERVPKEEVPAALEKILKWEFPYVYSYHKTTGKPLLKEGKQKVEEECYDLADAIAVAIACYYEYPRSL